MKNLRPSRTYNKLLETNMRRKIPLREFVYKTLIRRIIVTATLITLLLLSLITLMEQRDNSEKIQQLAVDGAGMVNQSIIHYLDGTDTGSAQEILDSMSNRYIRHPDGYFVYYEIYDLQKQIIVRIKDNEYPNINAVTSMLDTVSRNTDIQQLPIFKRAKINGTRYAGVVLPLYDSSLQPKAFLLGVYAVSERAIAYFERRLRRSFFLVIFIVFLTSALLYPVIMRLTQNLAGFSTSLLNANLEMLETLGSTIAKRDSDTNTHNYRVTIIAVRLAEKLALSARDIQGLIKGAFLHDVGKIAIRDNILLKSGKLVDDEFAIMKSHVDHGIDIVKHSGWLSDGLDVVAGHHEKCDGSGYPAGKKREEIPVNARIFAIADVFDALTSKRPYKAPFSFEKTMATMQEDKGTHFDPQMLDSFETIAETLYHHLSGREDEALRQEVLDITQQYFSSGLDNLKYES